MIDQRVAIVTGGGSGIGRASCLALARHGVAVVVVNRTLSKAETVVSEILNDGGHALAIGADVAQSADVEKIVAAAVRTFGRLDILFNNAGISPSGAVTEISEQEWDECLNIDLKSVFLGSKFAIPEMQKRGGGVILNTAGTFGIRPAKNKAAYAAAKAGVINLTRSIALDYARSRIRCNAICPGYIETPLTEGVPPQDRDAFLNQYQPLNGVIQAEEVAAMVLYLCSDSARMITGQTFVIDGGQQAGIFQ
jgi:NAD(P)-dependent dehydrogenase (short-subunit alcohol dehydrogenase family)